MCITSLLSAICGTTACKRETVMLEPTQSEDSTEDSEYYVTHDGITEFICLCNSRSDAEAIAKDYGITLKVFAEGVATFESDKDPDEIFAYGEKHKLPELSLNTVYHID